VRIPLAVEPRILTALARSTYKWERVYDMRTSVERANSRLDVSFGFKQHSIRGLNKRSLRCILALCVMSCCSAHVKLVTAQMTLTTFS